MTTPLSKLLFLAAISLIYLPGFEAVADYAAARREMGCTTGSMSYRCRAFEHAAWGRGAPHAGTCDERRRMAQNCCQSWDPKPECLRLMNDGGRDNLTAVKAAAGRTPAPGATPGPGDVFGTIGQDQAKNTAGRNAAESMEGLCRALRAACQEGCSGSTAVGTDPGAAAPAPTGLPADYSPSGPAHNHADNARLCGSGLRSFAEGFKGQADQFQAGIDQNEAAKRQAAGGNPPGGSNPGGGGPPGTQQPQSQGKGGGNPMADLAKMLQGMAQQKQDEQPKQPPPIDCSNPAIVGGNCPPQQTQPVSDSFNKKAAEAEMRDPESTDGANNFNVASDAAGDTNYAGNGEKKFGTPATVSPVGGGGGGGIPGQGGAQPASLGAANAGYAAGNKNIADVIHGLGGGGGYAATNAAMQMQNGGASGGYTYGQGGNDQMRGMDLRQFLPGGKNDPTRKLAGGAGLQGTGTQIQSQSVNIWNRISERFKSRCSQGLLRDCIP